MVEVGTPKSNASDAAETPGGIVLCGGQSSRMGTPKEWLRLGHETMLQRVVRLVAQEVSPVIVVTASPDQDLPPLPEGTRRVADAVPGRGPLQGLATGLAGARDAGCTCAFVIAVDQPLLQPGFITSLLLLLSPEWDAVVPIHDQRVHGVTAVYRCSIAGQLQEWVEGGLAGVRQAVDLLRARRVDQAHWGEVDPLGLSLRNMNTPEDRHELERLVRVTDPGARLGGLP